MWIVTLKTKSFITVCCFRQFCAFPINLCFLCNNNHVSSRISSAWKKMSLLGCYFCCSMPPHLSRSFRWKAKGEYLTGEASEANYSRRTLHQIRIRDRGRVGEAFARRPTEQSNRGIPHCPPLSGASWDTYNRAEINTDINLGRIIFEYRSGETAGNIYYNNNRGASNNLVSQRRIGGEATGLTLVAGGPICKCIQSGWCELLTNCGCERTGERLGTRRVVCDEGLVTLGNLGRIEPVLFLIYINDVILHERFVGTVLL